LARKTFVVRRRPLISRFPTVIVFIAHKAGLNIIIIIIVFTITIIVIIPYRSIVSARDIIRNDNKLSAQQSLLTGHPLVVRRRVRSISH
jgi:hypothetical protein